MRSSTLVIVAGTLGLVGFLVWSMMKQRQVSCDLCISYEGRSACRGAAAPKRAEAIQAATITACAAISAGVTDTVACQRSAPSQLRCNGDP